MSKRILTTPIKEEDILDLRTGDVIYVSGRIITGRDDVHHRVVHEKMEPPVDFHGMGIFHAGPIIIEEPGKNTLVSIGPTSSIRMEDTSDGFLERTGAKIMIGKGGMGPKSSAACKKHKAIHCIFPGGCAVSAAAHVEEIEAVYWRELGMPECMWVLRVKEFGPLVVSIDTEGNNMFLENKQYYADRKDACMDPIIDYVKDFMNIEAQ